MRPITLLTAGRVKALMESEGLVCSSIRLFVLDEADKLLEKKFTDTINYIYTLLPLRKQMLVLSATYTPTLAAALAQYMRDPVHVRIDMDNPTLQGKMRVMPVVCFKLG